MARRDYYNTLGVKKTASQDELKRAYRALALKYHPDRNPEDVDAQRRFQEIAEAWEVLGDPQARATYDRLGPFFKANGQPPTPDELGEYLTDTIGGWFGKRGDNAPGEDIRYTLTVELEEVLTGVEKEVQVPRQCTCTRCGGEGADPDEGRRDCEPCEGTGKATGRRFLRQTCARCDGRGWVTIKKCTRCDGEGRHGSEDALKVKVPAGVATGQKLKVRGKGNDGHGDGTPGDLYVIVNVAEHELFQRRGPDLLCELPITFIEAALGAQVLIPTLSGSMKIRIPPGTSSGKILRLSGEGLPVPKQRDKRGDLHMQVGVEIPDALNADQRAALEEFDRRTGPEAHPRRAAFDAAVTGRTEG